MRPGDGTIYTLTMQFTNEAVWDRVLRTLLGLAMILVGWSVLDGTLWGAALKIFGFVPLVTGLIGWCPFYTLAGVATKKLSRNRSQPD
jgi:hypothetical protein